MPTSLQGGLVGQEQGPDPWASVPSPCIARDVHSAIDKSYSSTSNAILAHATSVNKIHGRVQWSSQLIWHEDEAMDN